MRAYRALSLDRVMGRAMTEAAQQFGVYRADLLGPLRTHDVVTARRAVWFAARRILGMSYPAIGAYFGGMHHTTIIAGVRTIEPLCKADPQFNLQVIRVQSAMQEAQDLELRVVHEKAMQFKTKPPRSRAFLARLEALESAVFGHGGDVDRKDAAE